MTLIPSTRDEFNEFKTNYTNQKIRFYSRVLGIRSVFPFFLPFNQSPFFFFYI